MYNNYGFVLEWNDLPESLREEKIDEYIRYSCENSDYVTADGENEMSVAEAVENEKIRADAEKNIEARFPIYF